MRNFLEISVPDIPNDIQFQFPNSNHDPFRRFCNVRYQTTFDYAFYGKKSAVFLLFDVLILNELFVVTE